MNPIPRTAAALAVAAVALTAAYGTARTASRTLAPAQHRTVVAAPADEHDPKEDVEIGENGRPDLGED
ncbi:hypothetical protein ABZ471_01665 [Streptomyces sp. NPDC005728]|uniref:hypothetical protein n=1 Tax=Streptomyces sp. NPDC005728 TaxID=3157054 RepID=UPI0033F398BA